MPGPSSCCVPWSTTPLGAVSLPDSRESRSRLQANRRSRHPERFSFRGCFPTAHSLACLRIAGCVTASVARLATGWAGSPFAARGLHPLDDEPNFMKSSHTSLPSDQPCLVAPKSLYAYTPYTPREDKVVAYSNQQMGYASAPKSKRFVGISPAGHLTFSSLCGIRNADGGDIDRDSRRPRPGARSERERHRSQRSRPTRRVLRLRGKGRKPRLVASTRPWRSRNARIGKHHAPPMGREPLR